MVDLVKDKKKCCGCGACSFVCPHHAIEMTVDEYGFIYPKIDSQRCVDCELCKKNCVFQTLVTDGNISKHTLAAYSRDNVLRNKASSGGIFEEIARHFIDNGGYVSGAVLDFDRGGVPYVYHIVSNDKKDLERMRGSKYVHSDTSGIFLEINELLRKGKKVLFSGTPCQVAQVKRCNTNYLHNLFLFEILCHGTPSLNMFQDAVAYWNTKINGTIISFRFRDKVLGWGHNLELIFEKNKRCHKKTIAGATVAYVAFFLKSLIIRPNCFSCPYTGEKRQGDISAGDYWGVQKYHPELNKEIRNGISCLLLNTEKGAKLLELCESNLAVTESSLDNVKVMNGSLIGPNCQSSDYSKVMSVYYKDGYAGIVRLYKKQMGISWYIIQIKAFISPKIKRRIRLLIKKRIGCNGR